MPLGSRDVARSIKYGVVVPAGSRAKLVNVNGGDAVTGRDALLHWCQAQTAPYESVHVTNFTGSWQDGLAFSALIHSRWPNQISHPDKLNGADKIDNIAQALAAGQAVGIPPLLDAEMTATMKPDAKSVMAYLAELRKVYKRAELGALQTCDAPAMSAAAGAGSKSTGSAEEDVAALLGGAEFAGWTAKPAPKRVVVPTTERAVASAVVHPRKSTAPPATPQGAAKKGPPPIPKGGNSNTLGKPPKQASPRPAGMLASSTQVVDDV